MLNLYQELKGTCCGWYFIIQFRLRHLKQQNMSELKWCDQYQLRWRRQSATSSDPQLSPVFDCTVNGWLMYAKHVLEELSPYHVVVDGKII